MTTVSLGASVPSEYAESFLHWSISHLGKDATTSDGLRALIADAIIKPRLPLQAHVEAQKARMREERGEKICQYLAEGDSYKKIGERLGLSATAVRSHESKYLRSLKLAEWRVEKLRTQSSV
jgi:DNA-binding NarL/FixJ family response regulator